MLVIDAQVHAYEPNTPDRPWLHPMPGPPEVSGEGLLAEMDSVGVDGALLVSTFAVYGYDHTYAAKVCSTYPDRLALVAPIDARADEVEAAAAESAAAGAVGLRLVGNKTLEAGEPGVQRVMRASSRLGLPMCIYSPERLSFVEDLAQQYPENQIVVDHLGLAQPITAPLSSEPFQDLPRLISLATFPNVAIKITGAATLSHEPYPFNDIWDALSTVFDAFGLDRCMWGTDWTRVTSTTYDDAVRAFRDTDRFSPSDLARLMGGSLTQIFDWSPGAN